VIGTPNIPNILIPNDIVGIVNIAIAIIKIVLTVILLIEFSNVLIVLFKDSRSTQILIIIYIRLFS